MPADYYAWHYRTGEKIQAGDQILWAGTPGVVLFVVGAPDVPVEWADPMEWLGEPIEGGLMLEVEGEPIRHLQHHLQFTAGKRAAMKDSR